MHTEDGRIDPEDEKKYLKKKKKSKLQSEKNKYSKNIKRKIVMKELDLHLSVPSTLLA